MRADSTLASARIKLSPALQHPTQVGFQTKATNTLGLLTKLCYHDVF